jgi:glycosyltransferase involved in cell wall biosynthesis
MDTNQALLIIGQDIKSLHHHRGDHLSKYLAKRFIKVDIVSITKMYDGPGTDPIWKKGLLGLRDILCRRVKKIQEGNIVHYIVRFPRLPGLFDYLLRDFWTYATLRSRLRDHYDVCILAHPRLAFVGLHLKRLEKANMLIYEDWDYFPGHSPGGLVWRKIMRYREEICVRGADGVVSVSRQLHELRKEQGARQSAFIPNGVDFSIFKKTQQPLNHPPTLLYMGSLDEPWGADLPIQALPIIRREIPEIRYIVLGGGVDEDKLRVMVDKLGLEDIVIFCGWQEYEKLPSFLAQADIGVATYRDYEFVRLSRPMKIIEYMAGGLPVIGTAVGGEAQTIIESAIAGEIIEFSAEAFAGAVVDLLSNQTKYDLYSSNAILFAQEHDWEYLLDKEMDFIRKIATDR